MYCLNALFVCCTARVPLFFLSATPLAFSGSTVEYEDGVPIQAGGNFASGLSSARRSRSSFGGSGFGGRVPDTHRGTSEGLWDDDDDDGVPDDVAIAWGKLRKGFDKVNAYVFYCMLAFMGFVFCRRFVVVH